MISYILPQERDCILTSTFSWGNNKQNWKIQKTEKKSFAVIMLLLECLQFIPTNVVLSKISVIKARMLLWILTSLDWGVLMLFFQCQLSFECHLLPFDINEKMSLFAMEITLWPQGKWITVWNYCLAQRWGKSTGLLNPFPVVLCCSYLPSCGSKNLTHL